MTRRRRGYRWDCHACGAYGYEGTPDAARDAGEDHYVAAHDAAPGE